MNIINLAECEPFALCAEVGSASHCQLGRRHSVPVDSKSAVRAGLTVLSAGPQYGSYTFGATHHSIRHYRVCTELAVPVPQCAPGVN
jgi:hypothetical protein